MRSSENLNELAAALSAAQAEMPAAKFNAVNPFLKNKYAGLGSVIEASRPVLAKHGLSVSQLVIGEGSEIGVETVLLHKSGQWMSSVVMMEAGEEKGKSDAQVAGSIVSYLRRYSLAAILNMYADEDTDGNQGKQEQRKQEQKPAAKPEIEYPAELAVVTNSKGTPYVELDSEALGKMLIGIRKALADVGMSDDDKARYAAKFDAINQILALRNGK